jgi:hypothetical protein
MIPDRREAKASRRLCFRGAAGGLGDSLETKDDFDDFASKQLGI